MTPWKANLLLGFRLNEPAGIVTEKVPIWRVTFSVTGLIPLLFLPRVKDSFRSKLDGGPALISSFAKDEAKSTCRVIATATETGLDPAAKGEPVMGASAPVAGLIVKPETVLGAVEE